MNGCNVKRLLVGCGIDLNKYEYFDNSKTYEIEQLPNIAIDIDILKQCLNEKYGNDMCKYIMMKINNVNNDNNKVMPNDILKIICDQ